MGKHARLAPSAAARWINCPGSVALSEQVPQPEGTAYTKEGTEAHKLGELKLRLFMDLDNNAAISRKIGQFRRKAEYFDGEMEEATDRYADLVSERFLAAGPYADLMLEQKFSLEPYVPEGFGSADAVIIGGGTIEIIDLKYGKGVMVDARNNPQLRLYGLGAALLFGELYDFSAVRLTIIQPRLDHISTEELPLSELMLWAEEEVMPRARMAMDDTDYVKAGDWCRWCPAKAVCRARADENLDLARLEFKKPALLQKEELGEVLRQAEALQAWASDVKAYCFDQMLAGEKYDGWKLVEGRSNRKYADDLKVAETLTGAGYEEALLYERKLLGLTAMEKLVGKKKLSEILGDLIVKPEGKPTMVPASDPRAEYHSAKGDFSDL